MDEAGFLRFQGNHLDPTAQEFFPTATPNHLPLLSPQIYYTYPYPSPFCEYSMAPAYVSAAVEPLPPPPPPPPPALLQPCLPPPMMTPSRALLLSLVPADVSESIVRRELEAFGDVRAVQMDRVRDGMVTVHFYDLRHAQTALVEIQEQHMQQQCRLRRHYDAVLAHNSFGFVPPPLPPPARGLISGRAVWAQFTFPVVCNIPDGCNQGTLVIFNLDPDVSPSSLQQVFQAFGPVRELRDTPMKKHQRFVEFYDTRDAARAIAEMNGKEMNGKRIVIEFSRPGGHSKRLSKGNYHLAAAAGGNNKFNSMDNNYSSSKSSHFSPPPPPPSTPPPTLQRKMSMSRKSSFLKNPNGYGGNGGNGGNGSGLILQDSMASLSVNANGYEESSSKMKSSKKNSKKGNNSSGGKQQAEQQHKAKSSKQLWRGSRQSKEYDPRFLINEDAIMVESNCRDSRTTVMIKNIPNKYSQKLLLNMLDNHCIHCNDQIAADGDDQPLSSYDFVYLPIDFINKCNVGYGFVNMTSPEATWRLYKAFHHRSWEVFNSRKICEVTYARLQGVEALQDHFKNSKFPCDEDEYLPVIFSPPRDGRQQLTEPVPIVGCNSINPPLLLSSSSTFSSNQDQSEASYDNVEDEMHGQDLLEQEVNDGAEHIDDDDQDVGVGGGGSSPNGGYSEDHNDNDDA